jgi:hypothetical protein
VVLVVCVRMLLEDLGINEARVAVVDIDEVLRKKSGARG